LVFSRDWLRCYEVGLFGPNRLLKGCIPGKSSSIDLCGRIVDLCGRMGYIDHCLCSICCFRRVGCNSFGIRCACEYWIPPFVGIAVAIFGAAVVAGLVAVGIVVVAGLAVVLVGLTVAGLAVVPVGLTVAVGDVGAYSHVCNNCASAWVEQV